VKDVFERRTRVDVSVDELFAWHERPGAFERLQPPWERVEVVQRSGGITDGARVELEARIGPLPVRWVVRHTDYERGRRFRDVQERGPFATWEHTHSMEPAEHGGAWLSDRIEYALPLGAIGRMLGGRSVRKRLERMFAYRHRVMCDDLAARAGRTGVRTMNVLVSGSTGLVGSALVPMLTTSGHSVTRLVRNDSAPALRGPAVVWDPAAGTLDPAALDGISAVVHLAGENVAGRWTAEKRQRIRESRVRGTRTLVESLLRMRRPPSVVVCASAIGYYGNRGDELLTEASAAGRTFLSEVCVEWEQATAPLKAAGIRVVNLRLGMVLSPRGGALARMLSPFQLGLGGVIGDGRQQMSWVAIDDVIGAIGHVLSEEGLQGPVNIVSPRPVTCREFTRVLARVLRRPAIFPVPGFAARLAFGEMADELLLGSLRVHPERLLDSGYRFRFPELEGALRHLLGRQLEAA